MPSSYNDTVHYCHQQKRDLAEMASWGISSYFCHICHMYHSSVSSAINHSQTSDFYKYGSWFFFIEPFFLLAVGGQPHNLHPLQPRLLHCRPETSSKLPQKSAQVLPPKTSKEDSPAAKLSTFSWIASKASDQWGANGGRGNERVSRRKSRKWDFESCTKAESGGAEFTWRRKTKLSCSAPAKHFSN